MWHWLFRHRYHTTPDTDLTMRLNGISARLETMRRDAKVDEFQPPSNATFAQMLYDLDYVVKILHKHLKTGET